MGNKYKNMKNYKFHKESCMNSCECGKKITQNQIIIESTNQFKFMLKQFIIKYYSGVFTIKKNNDIELEKTLNYLLLQYFKKGKIGFYKVIDQYFVVDINITRRRNNNIPYQFNINYLNEKGIQKTLTFNGDYKENKKVNKNILTDFNNIKVLENEDCVSILGYVNSLIELATTIYQSIIRKVVVQNSGILALLPKQAFEDLKKVINKTITMANGAITFIGVDTLDQLKTMNLSENVAEYISKMTGQLTWVLDLIKDTLGMRYNSNFKLERNINAEYDQDNIVFSVFERNLKDDIQHFIKEINNTFFKDDKEENKAFLSINTKFLTNDDNDISFNNIKNFAISKIEEMKNTEKEE